eukprot:UN34759
MGGDGEGKTDWSAVARCGCLFIWTLCLTIAYSSWDTYCDKSGTDDRYFDFWTSGTCTDSDSPELWGYYTAYGLAMGVSLFTVIILCRASSILAKICCVLLGIIFLYLTVMDWYVFGAMRSHYQDLIDACGNDDCESGYTARQNFAGGIIVGFWLAEAYILEPPYLMLSTEATWSPINSVVYIYIHTKKV